MRLSSENSYSANIPLMPEKTDVKYKIIVYDNENNHSSKDNFGNYFTYTIIPEFSVINLVSIFFIVTISSILLRYKMKFISEKSDEICNFL